MHKIINYVLLGTFGTAILMVLIAILIKTSSLNNNDKLDFSDLDALLDNYIESGINSRSFDKDDPLLQKRQILIATTINENIASEVVSKLFYLNSISNDSIYILISTNGGWGTCSKLIMETIKLIKSPVNTVVIGTCYSAGMLISVSATGKRYATENSIFMLHANLNPTGSEDASAKYYNKWYEAVFEKYTEMPAHWYPMVNDRTYYFDTESALQYKVIDEIIKKL